MPYETTEVTPARIYLQPVAAPSILGLFGFAAAMFMIAANMVHWYGTASSGLYLTPFVVMFGGLAQFLAGMWAFKARDGLATAVHCLWGSFFIAYGILNLMLARAGTIIPTGGFPELGFWFVVAAAITWMCAWAALAENMSLFLTFAFLALGSTLAAIARLSGSMGNLHLAAGYALVVSAVIGYYTATAMMLAEVYGHEVLSVGKARRAVAEPSISLGTGEPGVVRGQNLNLAPQASIR
ncbi:MAG TPA: GPR1/FUN34/YaaH family transporter [Bryobacteraceae bacterium]